MRIKRLLLLLPLAFLSGCGYVGQKVNCYNDNSDMVENQIVVYEQDMYLVLSGEYPLYREVDITNCDRYQGLCFYTEKYGTGQGLWVNVKGACMRQKPMGLYIDLIENFKNSHQ